MTTRPTLTLLPGGLAAPAAAPEAPLAEILVAEQKARAARPVRDPVAYGAKYAHDRDVTEIAKLVRADIKSAVAAGELPKTKYSVTVSRYSMGRSLTVSVGRLPFAIVNEERVKNDVLHPHDRSVDVVPWLTEAAKALDAKLEALVAAYNFDGSDLQSDYHNVNFHVHVLVEGDGQREEEWALLRAKYEAQKAEALRPVREANLAAHAALAARNAEWTAYRAMVARRNACPAAAFHDPGAGCSLCDA